MKEKKISNDQALDVAGEMLSIPMRQLPPVAIEFLKYKADQIGMCIEVCLTSYAYYNQAVLYMKCRDKSYKIPEKDLQWFIDKGYAKRK